MLFPIPLSATSSEFWLFLPNPGAAAAEAAAPKLNHQRKDEGPPAADGSAAAWQLMTVDLRGGSNEELRGVKIEQEFIRGNIRNGFIRREDKKELYSDWKLKNWKKNVAVYFKEFLVWTEIGPIFCQTREGGQYNFGTCWKSGFFKILILKLYYNLVILKFQNLLRFKIRRLEIWKVIRKKFLKKKKVS